MNEGYGKHDFTHGATVWNKGYAFPKPLSEDELRAQVPSIFAEQADPDVSDRYLFIPTWEILERVMRDTSLVPVRAREVVVREEGNRAYAKHEITLRQQEPDREWRVGDSLLECRLTNAHNRSSAYAVDAGLYRFVCSNALLVPSTMMPSIRVRHSGSADMLTEIVDGTWEVLNAAPQLQERIETYGQTQLAQGEQRAFAKAAAVLRWEDEEKIIVAPERLLECKREEDKGDDAWHVLNRVQENLTQGGQRGLVRTKTGRTRRARVRPIKSISEDQRINKALWTLTDELLKARELA